MSAMSLRTNRERTLFTIAFVVSLGAWLVLTVTVIGLAYSLLLGLAVLMAHCLLMAHVIGNGVRVSAAQLPDVWAKVQEASRKLGLPRPPEVYVVQAGGILNAFATKILSRRFVIIYSQLLDACGDADAGRPSELDFIIGHEIGHLAAGHLAWQWFLLPARLVPLLGAAYSRAREYTCDLCGHAVVGDLEVSSRALTILAAGAKAGRRVNLDMFVEQVADTGRFWMAVFELNASHPFLSKRVTALRAATGIGIVRSSPRNFLAYPLAPVLGFGGGPVVMLVLVTYLAFLAALPLIKKYFEPARVGAAAAETGSPPSEGAPSPSDEPR
jgi:Zn-dependent protease with chaperone function